MENNYTNRYILETGIGLQDVDHLKNSSYFLQESERYLKGEISLDELDDIVNSYYRSKPVVGDRSEEADKISIRIARIISENSFTFTVGQLLSIHRILFEGILDRPGQLRTYNFSKKEWVLDGASVIYGDYRELEATLQYDFDIEKRFDYSKLSMNEIIEHLAIFIANLWQIHVFEEGNTRTIAVFTIKYLRSLGFDVTNDTFAKNAWYFRNSLVRANYTNLQKGIHGNRTYLIKFLRNLLLNENNLLENKELHIVPLPSVLEETKENRLLRLLKGNPTRRTDELAMELGVSLRTIKSIIAALRKDGKLERVGGKKYGRWEVKQDNSVLIENDNLQIVKMNKSMYFDIYQNSLDEDNRKYVPDEVFNSLEEASEVVNHIISAYDSEDGPFVYSVIRKKDNINLGYVQLVKLEEGWEIGYHIAKLFTGNGYATEAVNLFIKYIQNNTNIKQIFGIALAANKASRRVLEKCGFELIYEGDGLYQGSKRKIIKTIKFLKYSY